MKSHNEKMIDILIRIVLILAIAIAIFFFALKPMFFKKDFYYDSDANIVFGNLDSNHDKDSYDVVVLGDTLDGIYAAIGSASVGAKTLLVCPSDKLGEDIRKTYNVNWSLDISPTGNSVSSDIFKETRYKAGDGSNIDSYLKVLNEMVSAEKKLEVLYNAELSEVILDMGTVSGINLILEGKQKKINGRKFIDATRDGEFLQECDIPYSTGYNDVGIEELYLPVKLNFMISGVDYTQLKEFTEQQATLLNMLIKSYRTNDKDIIISGFNITDQGNSNVIIEAVAMRNVDLQDQKQLEEAYQKASDECMNFYNYLKLNIDQFKNATKAKIAEKFIMASPYHFEGRYVLTLTDVLTGKRFSDRISTAVRPVTLTMKDGTGYILCNPKIFYVPLRTLIPAGLNNVLMTGDKISSSSLVQAVIGSNSSRAGTGYAAGIIAAYSISKKIEIPQIVEDHNLDTQVEIERTLRKLGLYMSDTKEDLSGITGNWSFPYVEKLNNIGLLSAGITNDFKFDKEAKSEDFAFMVLNGVARVSKAAYNYDFDIKARKYLTKDPLTKENFAKILLDFAQKNEINNNYYSEACKLGLIDETLQDKLKNIDVLSYAEVYYASVQFIEKLTGKTMK